MTFNHESIEFQFRFYIIRLRHYFVEKKKKPQFTIIGGAENV